MSETEEIKPIKLNIDKQNKSWTNNIHNNEFEQSIGDKDKSLCQEEENIVNESDNSNNNATLNDNKTEAQTKIDNLITTLQDEEKIFNIYYGSSFKNIKKDKNEAFYQLIRLLKNQDNQNYFLSLCEQGNKITFTLFSRILQECSFVEEYIKLNNALVLNYYDNNVGSDNTLNLNKVIIFKKNNVNNESLQQAFQQINKIQIINHAKDDYGQFIGQKRKYHLLTSENNTTLQVFTYNSPSNWFYPTIDGSEQRATAQSTLLSEIIDYKKDNKICLSIESVCSGNYFGFDLLNKALLNNNHHNIVITNIKMANIIEDSLFHMGAKDIARKFIELAHTHPEIFQNTTISFVHMDNFFHKNGCKEFADALTTILNSEKEYNNVIDIIKSITFENTDISQKYKKDPSYIEDQLLYFKNKLKEINNDKAKQNIATINSVKKSEDKVCCGCCGLQ